MLSPLNKFQQDLGVQFSDIDLLRQALTHRAVGKHNNERLEFLGDSILGMEISILLFKAYPSVSEGDLSRFRAVLVCKEALANLAKQYHFSEVLILAENERKSGGNQQDSILADAFEAVIGALFLNQGREVVRDFLERIYYDTIKTLPKTAESLKDPKTVLQELLQAKKIALPIYNILAEKTTHPQWFKVSISVPDLQLNATAEGSSRRRAEKEAAKIMLLKLHGIKNDTT